MQSASTDPSSAAGLHLKTKDLSATNSSEESASGSPRDPANMSFVDALDGDGGPLPQTESPQGQSSLPQPPALYLTSQSESPDSERGDAVFVSDVLTDCEVLRVPGNGPSIAQVASPTLTTEAQELTGNSQDVRNHANSTSSINAAAAASSAAAGTPGCQSRTTNETTINQSTQSNQSIQSNQSNQSSQSNHGRGLVARRSSLGFFSNWASSIRGNSNNASGNSGIGASGNLNGNSLARESPGTEHNFMSNSPTIANLSSLAGPGTASIHHLDNTVEEAEFAEPQTTNLTNPVNPVIPNPVDTNVDAGNIAVAAVDAGNLETSSASNPTTPGGLDGLLSVRLTPIIDHSSASSGLYFSPVIRRIKPNETIAIGRYTEKNKSAAHAPQGSSRPIVFKSKVVSRTHALLQCRSDGLWFLKDCKSSSGTFLNNVRLSQATMELTYWPVVDGDIIQLGLDYRGGAEDIYRCVKMRCEFNHSWQRKVNQYNLEIHERMKNLRLETDNPAAAAAESKKHVTECAICLMTLDPCQALFISPCSHSWHYKCIRPVIIKSYPQFYCPNCRSMCDLETDIEDEI